MKIKWDNYRRYRGEETAVDRAGVSPPKLISVVHTAPSCACSLTGYTLEVALTWTMPFHPVKLNCFPIARSSSLTRKTSYVTGANAFMKRDACLPSAPAPGLFSQCERLPLHDACHSGCTRPGGTWRSQHLARSAAIDCDAQASRQKKVVTPGCAWSLWHTDQIERTWPCRFERLNAAYINPLMQDNSCMNGRFQGARQTASNIQRSRGYCTLTKSSNRVKNLDGNLPYCSFANH